MTVPDHDRLAARVLEDPTCDETWDEVCAEARRVPALWRTLAETERDELALGRLGVVAHGVADRVEIRDRPADDDIAGSIPPVHVRPRSAWVGWAVAAIVFMAWTVTGLRPGAVPVPGSPPDVQSAGVALPPGVIPVSNADEALDAYLEKGRAEGRVVREVPELMLIESMPSEGGEGFEVIYVRQVVERARVRDLYQFGAVNEEGRPTLVRVRATVRGSM